MNYFVRLTVGILWCLFVYFVASIFCVFRWGDPKNFSQANRIAARGLMRILGIKVQFKNKERMVQDDASIFMGNHQSMLDVYTFGTETPDRVMVVLKKQLRWVPVFNCLMWGSGQIFIDRSNRERAVKSLEWVANRMKSEGFSTAIAPEGTRNRSSDPLLPFKKGGFHLAIQAQAKIVPVVCAPLAPLFDARTRTLKPGKLEIVCLEPISTAGLSVNDVDSLMERVRSEMISAYELLQAKSSSVGTCSDSSRNSVLLDS